MVNPNPIPLPRLLLWDSLINAEFTTASSNDGDVKSYVCVDCCSDSLSEREKIEKHKDHTVFRAVQNFEHFCYRQEDIKRLGIEVLDVSKVCAYKVGSTRVYYPKPRSSLSDNSKKFKKSVRKCWSCDHHIKKSGAFCSILCKLQWTAKERERQERCAESSNTSKRENENVGGYSNTRQSVKKKAKKMAQAKSEKAAQTTSYRMRNRKGKPRRAPLF